LKRYNLALQQVLERDDLIQRTNIQIRKLKQLVFLKDVLVLALSAFGGPQIHYLQFMKRLVRKKHYLTESELVELNSFCQMLPGPTSTQIITSIGFKLGGPLLAFLTLTLWIFPACLLMFLLALLLSTYESRSIDLTLLKFIQPMAVGFMVYAAVSIGRMFAKTRVQLILLLMAAITASFVRSPVIFPVILLLGGVVSNMTDKQKLDGHAAITNVRWDNFILFIAVFLLSAVGGALFKNIFGSDMAVTRAMLLFENNYRYGSLVFGGGNVLVPMIYEQLVLFKKYLSAQDFMTGLGLLQAIPGPVFSFASFAGGMSMASFGKPFIAVGSIIGSAGIFLPGIFLIFFLYPLWDQFKHHPKVQKAVSGINAASAGLVVASAYLLFEPLGYSVLNISIVAATSFVLYFTRISPPLVVAITLLCGFIF
jgi:chromate transporter